MKLEKTLYLMEPRYVLNSGSSNGQAQWRCRALRCEHALAHVLPLNSDNALELPKSYVYLRQFNGLKLYGLAEWINKPSRRIEQIRMVRGIQQKEVVSTKFYRHHIELGQPEIVRIKKDELPILVACRCGAAYHRLDGRDLSEKKKF